MRRGIRQLHSHLRLAGQLCSSSGSQLCKSGINGLQLWPLYPSYGQHPLHHQRALHQVAGHQPTALPRPPAPQQPQSSSSQWVTPGSLWGVGALAAGIVLSSSNLAYADQIPSNNKQTPLEAARDSLAAQWQEVRLDLARANASLPWNVTEAVGVPPYVEMSWNAATQQEALRVHIPIRAGADAEAVIREAMSAFSNSGGNRSQMRTLSGDGSQVCHIEIRPTTSIGGPSQTAGSNTRLVVKVSIPPAGSEEGGGEVIVEKTGPAGLSASEMGGLGRLVRAANLGSGTDQRSLSKKLLRSHDLPSELDDMISDIQQHLHRGFLGQFGSIMEEMKKQMEEVMQGEGGEEVCPEAGGFRSFPPRRDEYSRSQPQEPTYTWGSLEADQAVKQLQSMGAKVYPPAKKDKMDWGVLAGYEDVKRTLEDCLLFPLLRPEVFTRVAEGTRAEFQSNRPRAVLFEGPPGTGKTTSARVIASQASVPMIYVPLEAVLSKWFGESEHLIAKVFQAAEALGGAIIFIDELDSLGGSRDREMHEVSRRILSVLLREMEGFDTNKKAVVIGATNRKSDLDAALLSRFDLIIHYPLPDEEARSLILQRYAKQLSVKELETLSQKTGGLSGRDLRDVAETTERRWASKIIRGEVPSDSAQVPPLAEYLKSASERMENVTSVMRSQSPGYPIPRPRTFF